LLADKNVEEGKCAARRRMATLKGNLAKKFNHVRPFGLDAAFSNRSTGLLRDKLETIQEIRDRLITNSFIHLNGTATQNYRVCSL
jgi:hypothetical protein